MKSLVEYPLEGGGSIIIETDEPQSEALGRAGRGEIVARATQTFEAALETIKPTAVAIIGKLRDLAVPADQIGVEFGLKFGAKAGTFIASADTEANFKITLIWKHKE